MVCVVNSWNHSCCWCMYRVHDAAKDKWQGVL